ncbi:insulin-like growth factor-binding protein 7 isoform X2 [Hoplias malabaricus]|uniref:insulin-like growth factor-binding protein 7 isoform X2 n=1 Tax=Hoplias malabaricus TaxID=27720 RepID=UPI003462F4FD
MFRVVVLALALCLTASAEEGPVPDPASVSETVSESVSETVSESVSDTVSESVSETVSADPTPAHALGGLGDACNTRTGAARCAPGLECVKNKTKGAKKGSGVCTCTSDYEVCGTDDENYATACELKAASARAQSEGKEAVKVQHKGKCHRAPSIVTAPGEVWNVTGSQVYLSCEVTGIPTPILTWKKISGDKMLPLPGDHGNLAIQTRGGPEKHEVTGWVLVFPLSTDDAGSYECHASNAKGEASAVGYINVVESIKDIPTKKVKDDEL